jgi:hypothetical protein
MKHVALAIASQLLSQLLFYLGTVFNNPNAWFMRAAETVSPSPGGEGRGEGGLQTKIELYYIHRLSHGRDATVFYVITASRASWFKRHGSNQRNASR